MFLNDNMKIDSILVTQRKLKRKNLLHNLIDAICNFETINPIQLVQLENGTVYCNDGHHRLAAYKMLGREELEPHEYDLLLLDEVKPTFGNIQKLLA